MNINHVLVHTLSFQGISSRTGAPEENTGECLQPLYTWTLDPEGTFMHTILLRGSKISFISHTQCGKTPEEVCYLPFFPRCGGAYLYKNKDGL